jgi:hypothetical protein
MVHARDRYPGNGWRRVALLSMNIGVLEVLETSELERIMETGKTIIDISSPAQIAGAMKRVNQTPELRGEMGTKILWELYNWSASQ